MKRNVVTSEAVNVPPKRGDASASARRASIEQSAAALGRTWAEHFRRDLHREGRAASGGWPGTLREARSRVGLTLVLEVQGRRSVLSITEAEREIAVRMAYSSARDEWRKHVEPEPP